MTRAFILAYGCTLALVAALTAPAATPPPAPPAAPDVTFAPALSTPKEGTPWEAVLFYPVCADSHAERQAMLDYLRAATQKFPRRDESALLQAASDQVPTRLAAPYADALRAQAVPTPPPAPPVLRPGPAWQEQLLAFVPIVAPLVIAVLKTFISRLPGWSLPILCTSLGVLASWLTTGSLTQQSALVGAVLGGAGVAVREVVDQLRQRLDATPPGGGGGVTRAGATYAFAAFLILLVGVGCANVGNRAKDTTVTVTQTPKGETVTVTRTREVESQVSAVGDAKQAIQAMSARNTATTQSIGTEGVTQESTLAGVVELLKGVFELGKSVGAKGGL